MGSRSEARQRIEGGGSTNLTAAFAPKSKRGRNPLISQTVPQSVSLLISVLVSFTNAFFTSNVHV